MYLVKQNIQKTLNIKQFVMLPFQQLFFVSNNMLNWILCVFGILEKSLSLCHSLCLCSICISYYVTHMFNFFMCINIKIIIVSLCRPGADAVGWDREKYTENLKTTRNAKANPTQWSWAFWPDWCISIKLSCVLILFHFFFIYQYKHYL